MRLDGLDVLIMMRREIGLVIENTCTRSDEDESRIIIKNEKVHVNLFFGLSPYAPGHIVIEPRNNVHDITELNADHWNTLSKWIPIVSKAMKVILTEIFDRKVEKIYICSFNKSEEYPVHIHLIPRYELFSKKGPELLVSDEKILIPLIIRDKIVNKMKKVLTSLN